MILALDSNQAVALLSPSAVRLEGSSSVVAEVSGVDQLPKKKEVPDREAVMKMLWPSVDAARDYFVEHFATQMQTRDSDTHVKPFAKLTCHRFGSKKIPKKPTMRERASAKCDCTFFCTIKLNEGTGMYYPYDCFLEHKNHVPDPVTLKGMAANRYIPEKVENFIGVNLPYIVKNKTRNLQTLVLNTFPEYKKDCPWIDRDVDNLISRIDQYRSTPCLNQCDELIERLRTCKEKDSSFYYTTDIRSK